MNSAITATNFKLKSCKKFYRGKVRDVYYLKDGRMVMVATDRISAFDVVLPEGIPYKGQVLNQIAAGFLNTSRDIIPNWLQETPHPMVSIGQCCKPLKVEMVVRGYLAGHAAREYAAGKRILCGVKMPDGMLSNQSFGQPIITPTTKADEGHDEDISREEIISRKIVSESVYKKMEEAALRLFERGTVMAAEQGLILVDTKYEFGLLDGELFLMDEIHTPDSSRFFYAEGYEERLQRGENQKQLSKEFVREWLMSEGFQGKEGQKIPEMTPKIVSSISERYIELFELVTGRTFTADAELYHTEAIEQAICQALDS
jgi:phosphoribosylaminoimidazole-succinocarboxamide synthase